MPQQPLRNPIGTPFIELDSIDSTNNYALAQVNAGLAQHGVCYFAHEQLAGKGQRGKSWASGRDSSLILSVVIDPSPLLLTQQFQLSACIAVAVCEFFSKLAGDATRIKWPNDLYWHDRKAGGILIENLVGPRQSRGLGEPFPPDQQTGWRASVAGIGINLNQGQFDPELKNPVSLRQITGCSFDPASLARELAQIIHLCFEGLLKFGFNPVYEAYQASLYKRGERVKLRQGTRSFEGLLKGITPDGRLIVQTAVEEEFNFGEIEWILD